MDWGGIEHIQMHVHLRHIKQLEVLTQTKYLMILKDYYEMFRYASD